MASVRAVFGLAAVRRGVPILVLCEVALLVYGRGLWGTSWVGTVEWTGGVGLLIGPLTGGLGAWNVVAHRRLLGAVAATSPVRLRANLVTLGGVVALVWAVHLATVVVALGITAWRVPGPSWAVLQVGVHLAALAGYAAVGHVVATVVRGAFVAPAVTVGLFLVPMAAYGGPLSDVLVTVGGSSGAGTGYSFALPVSGAQAVLYLCPVLVALAVPWTQPATIGWWGKSGVALALVVMLAVGTWLTASGSPRFTVSAAHGTDCSKGDPTVCVVPDSGWALAELERDAGTILGTLDRLGVPSRIRVFQQYVARVPASTDPTVRAFFLEPTSLRSTRSVIDDLTPYIGVDRHCLWSLMSDEAATSSALVALAWLAEASGGTPATMPSGLSRLDDAARKDWLRKVLRAADACDIRAIPPVPGP